MYCADCGTRNELDATYCRACGVRLARGGGALTEQSPPALQEPEGPSDRAENLRLLQRAGELQAAGRLDDAIEACRRVVVADPRNRQAHALLGGLYEAKGQPAAAIREYRLVLTIDPRSPQERERLRALTPAEAPLTGRQAQQPQWARRLPLWLGLAAAVFVISLVAVAHSLLTRRTRSPSGPIALKTVPPKVASVPALPAPAPSAGMAMFTPSVPGPPPYGYRPEGLSPFSGRLSQPGGLGPAQKEMDLRTPALARIQVPRNEGAAPHITVPSDVNRLSVTTPRTRDALPGLIEPVGPESGSTGAATAPPGLIEPEPQAAPPRGRPIIEIWRSDESPEPTAPEEKPSAGRGPSAAALRSSAARSGPSDLGRQHQSQAAALRRKSQFSEAIQEYKAAISAYEQARASGSASAANAQAVEACKAGIAFCQSKLGGS